MSPPNPLSIGINVSKPIQDIAATSDIALFTVCNDSNGFDSIITGLRQHSVALILMEATDGLKVALAPLGRPVTSPVQWDILQRLTALTPESSRRWQPIAMFVAERNRLHPSHPQNKKSIIRFGS